MNYIRRYLLGYFYLRHLYQTNAFFKEKWNKKNKDLPMVYRYIWGTVKLDKELFVGIIKYCFLIGS